jgi:hypothetical protein
MRSLPGFFQPTQHRLGKPSKGLLPWASVQSLFVLSQSPWRMGTPKICSGIHAGTFAFQNGFKKNSEAKLTSDIL